MLKQFENFLFEELKIDRGQKILLAISGGMDSMCMWHLFRALKLNYGIAHCNFKLRGSDSDEDEQFVRESCNSNEKFFSESFDTKAYAKDKKISIQMAARALRYDFFEEIKAKHQYDLVAVAHHLDDQIETFFIQLMRKSGIGALGGMPVRNNKLVRPLMFAYRAEIQSYVKEQRLIYREDKSNASDAYLRNSIRHHLIPALKIENPDLSMDVLDLMTQFESADSITNEFFVTNNEHLLKVRGEEYVYQIDAILALSSPEIFLEKLLLSFGFNASNISDVWTSINGQSGKMFYAPNYKLLKDRRELIIVKKDMDEEPFFEIEKENLSSFMEIPFEMKIVDHKAGYELGINNNCGQFDYDKLKQGVIFRKWKEGDYFFPIGLKGKKKLSNFFVDEKYNLLQKERQWLMCTGGDICWIVGKRVDDRYKVDEKTKRILELEYKG